MLKMAHHLRSQIFIPDTKIVKNIITATKERHPQGQSFAKKRLPTLRFSKLGPLQATSHSPPQAHLKRARCKQTNKLHKIPPNTHMHTIIDLSIFRAGIHLQKASTCK